MALSVQPKGDNTYTHLGFSRGSGPFWPKPTGLLSASSTVSSWNSASTLPWRDNMSEPQLNVLQRILPQLGIVLPVPIPDSSEFFSPLTRSYFTASGNCGPVRNCFADKELYFNELPNYLICLHLPTVALSKIHPWGHTVVQ